MKQSRFFYKMQPGFIVFFLFLQRKNELDKLIKIR